MTGMAAFVALVFTIPALLLGHQGQHWPLRGAWRWLRAHLTAYRAPEIPNPAPSPTRRPVPSWAHTEPYDYDLEEAA